MSKSESEQAYEDISVLFEHDEPPETLLNACYQAIEKYPTEPDFWCLSSRILQKLNRPDDARKDINQALQFLPFNADYNLQLFNVLIQQKQTDLIPRRINWLFEHVPPEAKIEIARYADVAIGSGLISKLDLINEALVEVLKIRNAKENP